jgi:putative ABC transport system permease protein
MAQRVTGSGPAASALRPLPLALGMNVRAAFQALWQNRLRSSLTVLGVVIGVASAILLIAISEGAQREVTAQIESLGANLIFVVPGNDQGSLGFNPMSTVGLSTLTEQDVEAVRKARGVLAAVPLTFMAGGVRRGERWATLSLPMATTPNYQNVRHLVLTEGRFFTAGEDDQAICVLGSSLKDDLFPKENAVGKTVAVNRHQYRVIGVARTRAISPSVFGGGDLDAIAYLPLKAVIRQTGSRQVHRILALVDSRHPPDFLTVQIRGALKRSHSGVEDFTVLTPREVLGMFNKIINLLTSLLVGISAISLIVGGIGIMNIMLVSVTERTREIGIRKTVGARRADIFVQFLTEAVTLSLVGGLVGLGLAAFSAVGVAHYSPLRPLITPKAITLAMSVCVGVGIVFGVAPALKAARKDPIDAIRYE